LLLYPEIKEELIEWMRRQKELNITKIAEAISIILETWCWKRSPAKSVKSLSKYGLTTPVSRDTAWRWARICGAQFEEHGACSYTDRHEDKDVIRDRQDRYGPQMKVLELRLPHWIRITRLEYFAYVDAHKIAAEKLGKLQSFFEEEGDFGSLLCSTAFPYMTLDGIAMTEVHVHFLPAERYGEGAHSILFKPEAVIKEDCAYHSAEVCKCDCHLDHLGQDESIFHAFLSPKRIWKIARMITMRKKGNGPGRMGSALMSDNAGFGIPLEKNQLDAVNRVRVAAGEEP